MRRPQAPPKQASENGDKPPANPEGRTPKARGRLESQSHSDAMAKRSLHAQMILQP